MSAIKTNHRIDVLLTFDVEDVFSPPELGNDDSIKELADIMSEEGVLGVFLFIGDRAEQLLARGRHDVIAAVARHEVGLHTRSARHPCPPEYVAGKSWSAGVAEALTREREGVEIMARVFGRPACAMSTHNVFTSPHAHAVAAKLQLPFVYSYPAAPPLFSASWYAGSLCLPVWNTERGERSPGYGLEWDDVYPDSAKFEAQLKKHDELIAQRLAERQPLLTQLLYHPQRLRLAEFIDHFWAPNGVSLPPEHFGDMGHPRRYSPAEIKTARENFRRLVRRIRDDRRLRVLTMAELVDCYGRQPAIITRRELEEAARTTVAAGQLINHPKFSAAELLLGLAQAVGAFARDGRLPSEVSRVDVLGPTENPIIHPEVSECPWARLVAAAAECCRRAHETGHLPANFGVTFHRFGINHLFLALAAALPALAESRAPAAVALRRTPRCPPEAEAIGRRFLAIAEGELIDPALDAGALYHHGKLQTWTLKPAARTTA